MEDYRNKTKKVQIGNVCIGGGERIAIQSMTNTKTEDVEACVAQILKSGMRYYPGCGSDDGGSREYPQDQRTDTYSAGGRYSL